ncbi:MAG: ABC transporter ATP-binding protein, partial [Anaerolineales bacterium]|nr:ABC transporter ATP-binding protein [Anaerolineales bacterium]
YGQLTAVDALNLAIHPGEIYGLVGADGAGKTTTLRILAGVLSISDGEAWVAGKSLATDAEKVKPYIGYMAQQFSLYGDLSVRENLAFFADIYDVTGIEREERTRYLLEFAQLTQFQNRRAQHLSGGMQKKLALASTLIHQPDILLLDEPTTGVDPVSRREFWDILTELHLDGTTIVISTPYMDEAERCNRVALLHNGRLIRSDKPRDIQNSVEGDVIQLTPENWQTAQRQLKQIPGVLEIQTYGNRLHVLLSPGEDNLAYLESEMERRGIHYSGIERAPMRMEEAFISIVSKLDK